MNKSSAWKFFLLAAFMVFIVGCEQDQKTANQPPTATNDTYTVDEDQTLNVSAPGLLANDSDPDGDPLIISTHTSPSHGTLTIQNDGAFTYTPATNYNGPDSFTYTVSDGHGNTATATVNITVNPTQDPPTASLAANPSSGTAPLTVTFSRSASDPDGDPLSCTLDFGDGSTPATGCTGTVTHTYPSAGTYAARFTVDDGHGHTVVKTATITVDPGGSTPAFNIQLVYADPPSDPDVRQAFEDAAARWAEVITGDLPDVNATIAAGDCGNANDYQGLVDDLLIFVSVKIIDGSGGVLGMAGPCYLRSGSYLPYAGMMQFDADDLAWMEQNGTLKDVILHEMGHVLGIGTLWDGFFHLLDYDTSTCLDASIVVYHGAGAVNAWNSLGGSGNVPVEETGGAGTKCGHWQEATFDNELMTGWLNGSTRPLSQVTVGTLEDMGYQVNYTAADPYLLPSNIETQGAGFELREILIRPRLP